MRAWRHKNTRRSCSGWPRYGRGGRMTDMVPLERLSADDDPDLWAVVLETILLELGPAPGAMVEVGRCSHWLRPHQTRWTADGGFACPAGYGGSRFSRSGYPLHDWEVELWWSAETGW